MLAFALCAPVGARAAAPGPVEFLVGTAVVDITPTTPQYLGGYGNMDAPTSTAADPLQVRAFFVRRGPKAVAFASVDSQGWFAGYQEGPFGITDARAAAAAKISTPDLTMHRDDIIVSSTHTHAAPTIMGIWGPTDPAYLKLVKDATVDALVNAAASARRAQLWTGAGSIEQIIAHDVTGTDHYDGWSFDAEAPFLWARDPETLATLGLYVNDPVHPDSFKGSACGLMSADTPGVVRRIIDSTLGGTTVVADGTLGRQETIGPAECGELGTREIVRDGRYLANRIFAGLAHAEPITDGAIAGAEQLVLTPATNPALLALVYANTQGFQCFDGVACTIDRSVTPPYLAGNVIGTYVTSLRIGDYVWVSEPGEAFPEVADAIRRSVLGARAVHVVGMAQDQLGYYYPPEDYPSNVMYPSDFLIYNIGPELADANVRASALNATMLGFTGVPQHPMTGFEEPHTYVEPGVQFFPIVPESASFTVSFTGNSHAGGGGDLSGGIIAPDSVTKPTYDFGDGSPLLRDAPQQFDHTFPGPGSYTVTATTTDTNGATRSYSTRVVIDRAPEASVTFGDSDGAMTLEAGVMGGDGIVLGAHWSFSDGTEAAGLRVRRDPLPAGATVTVTVVDGVGDIATKTIIL